MSSPVPRPPDFRLARHRVTVNRFLAFACFCVGMIILAGQTNRYLQGPPHYEEPLLPFGVTTNLPPFNPESVARDNARLRTNWQHDMIDDALAGLALLAAAAFFYARSRKPPTRELLQLAKQHQGLLSLSEITLTLDIDPRLAHRALKILQSTGMASQRWQDLQKNSWEFPDYLPTATDPTATQTPANTPTVTSTLPTKTATSLPQKSLHSQFPPESPSLPLSPPLAQPQANA